jgi:exopolysaccharide production protein ExoQ
MNPLIALLLAIILILCLLRLDCQRDKKFSTGLWIPLAWVLIIGSRPVSAWIFDWYPNSVPIFATAADIISGSPIDRAVFLALITAAGITIIRRKVNWNHLAKRNFWIFLLFIYSGVSISWSDYSWVAFKRWNKAVGELLMILIVVTEDNPVEALRTLIRRCAIILLPLSIVFIKYFPTFGRLFDPWMGESSYRGVAQNKNLLGLLCLVCGLILVWDLVRSNANARPHNVRGMLITLLCLAMVVWLFSLAGSSTAIFCFIIGCILLVGIGLIRNGIAHIGKFLLLTVIILVSLEFTLDLSRKIVQALGREMTLTGRTELWKELLKIKINSFFGAGFESFWLGERMQVFWTKYWWLPNEAHNGYLEVYLNLGWTGILVLTGIVLSIYRKIRRTLIVDFEYGRIRLAFFVIALLYGVSEAAFRELTLVWFMFLFIAVDYPEVIPAVTQPPEKFEE